MEYEDSFAIVNDPSVSIVPLRELPGNTNAEGEIPVKLIYSKSKVYVHPSANPADFICGYISIVEKTMHEYLIAWTPETLIVSKDLEAFVQVDSNPEDKEDASTIMIPSPKDLPENKQSLYAICAHLEDIHSIVIQPPSITKWYGSLVINFKNGHSSAPLWFHDDESRSTVLQKNNQGGKHDNTRHGSHIRWGGDEFIDRISRLVPVTRSPEDSNLYLLGKRRMESTSTENEKTDNFAASSAATKRNTPAHQRVTDTNIFDSAQMDPLVATLKEARWNILERFSRVTKFTRDTTATLLGHPVAKQIRPLFSTSIQDMYSSDAVRATMDEYDSARIYLAKWAAGLAAQSEKETPLERKYRNVGVWGHNDTWEEETALGVFEVLNSENDFSIPTHTRTSPVTEEDWASFFDQDGKISTGELHVLERIFYGGLSSTIRKEAWLFLTGVYPWESSQAERERIVEEKRKQYLELKTRWADDPEVRESARFQDQKHRIDKDVHRTDRTIPVYAKEDMPNPDPLMHAGTNHNLEKLKDILCTYNIYNTELGYVQGMSDLLSPLYAVIEDEHLVFAAFTGFMERTKSNFCMDQSGMHKQLLTMDTILQFMDPALYKHLQRTDSHNLFFCFRWFLVWFKREFSWEDTMTMWEVLWTDYLSDKFIFFVALAILDQHRDFIIDYLKSFDEILKYVNDLSMGLNVQETLQRAEILFYQFRERVRAVNNKHMQLQQQIKENPGERQRIETELRRLPIVSEVLSDLLPQHEQNMYSEKTL